MSDSMTAPAVKRMKSASDHLLSLVKFWQGVSGLLFLTLTFVLVAWLCS